MRKEFFISIIFSYAAYIYLLYVAYEIYTKHPDMLRAAITIAIITLAGIASSIYYTVKFFKSIPKS